MSRTFAELANAAGTVTHARTPGAAEDVFELVVPSYRAAAAEQVLVRTFVQFSGGGSATVNGTVRFARTSR